MCVMYWLCVGYVLVSNWLGVGYVLVIYWLGISYALAMYCICFIVCILVILFVIH